MALLSSRGLAVLCVLGVGAALQRAPTLRPWPQRRSPSTPLRRAASTPSPRLPTRAPLGHAACSFSGDDHEPLLYEADTIVLLWYSGWATLIRAAATGMKPLNQLGFDYPALYASVGGGLALAATWVGCSVLTGLASQPQRYDQSRLIATWALAAPSAQLLKTMLYGDLPGGAFSWEHAIAGESLTQVSHKSHTGLTQVSQRSHTGLTQVSHKSHTGLTQVSHRSHTSLTQVSHKSHTSLTQVSHKSHTSLTQVSHTH